MLLIGLFGYLAYLDSRQQIPAENTQMPVETDVAADWNTIKYDELGFSLKYPNGFFEAGHEPQVLLSDANVNCKQVPINGCPSITWLIGNSIDTSLKNPDIIVNEIHYCHYQATDAAAGHRYYSDFYMTLRNRECFAVEMNTSETVCENYLPLEQGNTEQEKNYNTCVAQRENRPKILQQITGTFKFDETK